MQGEIEHDYLNVNTSDFINSIEVVIEEDGVLVYLELPDPDDPEGIGFRARFPWESLIDECLATIPEDCRAGPDGEIDWNEVAEIRAGWMAVLMKFIDRLLALDEPALAKE